MFMGIEMPAGDHVVELRYHTPGLLAVFVMLILGAVLLVILVRYEKRQQKVIE